MELHVLYTLSVSCYQEHPIKNKAFNFLRCKNRYNRLDRPVEYALINYNDGKIFLADKKVRIFSYYMIITDI